MSKFKQIVLDCDQFSSLIDLSLNNIITKKINYDIDTNEDTYENNNYVAELLKSYDEHSKNIIYSVFMNNQIMYIEIMDLKTNNKEILMKIGYSQNLMNRHKSLSSDFKCNLFTMGLKIVNSLEDEKKFHQMIEDKYPHLVRRVILKKKYKKKDKIENKFEIYKFDTRLVEEFFSYNIINNNQEQTKQILAIENTKQEQEKTKQTLAIENTKQEQEKTKQTLAIENTKQEQEKTAQEQEKTAQTLAIENTKQKQENTKQEQENTKQMQEENKKLNAVIELAKIDIEKLEYIFKNIKSL